MLKTIGMFVLGFALGFAAGCLIWAGQVEVFKEGEKIVMSRTDYHARVYEAIMNGEIPQQVNLYRSI